ncbi:MAG TPA: acetolactate decarboxylase [Desulfomonilaceae bacterium]|nr:acetolactate decarboxylase [Desulfomonilaceae bacterium]
MKRILAITVLLALLPTHFLCAEQAVNSAYQVFTITSLKQGLYGGTVAFSEVKKFGDFGLGTLEGLDGEMVALNGLFFQVKTDGKPYEISDTAKTPFALVTFFRPDKTVTLPGTRSLDDLQQALDKILPSSNLPYAIRIRAKFHYMKARSVPAQKTPYPELSVALKDQVIFEWHDLEGTLVGFRFPDYMDGVNVAGYHFHFLDADLKTGGHVLDCSTVSPEVESCTLGDFRIILPDNPAPQR